MPRAGWCRECGEWIWVDEDGSCQNGHGPDSVGSIYEAKPRNPQAGTLDAESDPRGPESELNTPEEPADIAPEVGFGVGEMPDDLYRFNWAAFTLPFVWGIWHGAWPIVMAVLGSVLLQLILGEALGIASETASVSRLVAWTVIAEVATGIVRLWAGLAGNSLLWRREAVRLRVLPNATPRFGPARFKARQRKWAIAGWVVLVLGLIATVAINYTQWAEYGLPVIGAVEPLVFIGAEVWLGVWLAVKMQAERPGTEAPAETPSEYGS